MKFVKPDTGILVVEKVLVHTGLYVPRTKEKTYDSTLCIVVSDSEFKERIFAIRDRDIYRTMLGGTELFLAREEVLKIEVIPEEKEIVDTYEEFDKYYALEDGNVIYTGNGIEEI